MNAMFCRAFQCCFAVGARFLPWRTPEVFSGEGSLLRAADILRENGLRRPFVIASRRQCADEHFRALQEKLDEQDILLSIFSSVEPNPSVETVENIAAQYKIDSCDCFLVIGGGSPMDCCKAACAIARGTDNIEPYHNGDKPVTAEEAAAARLARPDKPLSQLVGLLKVRRRIPPLIAVPTTAGTGSETTIAAVVTGSDHHKYAISDLCLIPRYAILDPALTVGLPPHITAETGMDALTHAVEAYLSRFYNTKQTRLLAENAVVTIFTHLERAYRDGTSLPDRAAMLQASFDAGAAFTRASVGNVHAIAHTLGGLYGVPHGLANAVLLPLVLEDYGKAAYPRLARLAALVGLKGESEESLAKAFIAEIRAMNARMDIPDHFNCIRKEDIPLMATWAAQEANPVYPVPVIYDEARFARVIERSHHSQ